MKWSLRMVSLLTTTAIHSPRLGSQSHQELSDQLSSSGAKLSQQHPARLMQKYGVELDIPADVLHRVHPTNYLHICPVALYLTTQHKSHRFTVARSSQYTSELASQAITIHEEVQSAVTTSRTKQFTNLVLPHRLNHEICIFGPY